MNKKTALARILLFFMVLAISAAQDIPALNSPVMDTAGIVSRNTKEALDSYLRRLYSATGVQIVVFTIPSLGDSDIESYSIQTADAWGLGKKGEDNGVLLLVSYKDREARIEVGYGLESVLTDAACGQILRNVIFPRFRTGNYDEGIAAGVQSIAERAAGNAAPQLDERIVGKTEKTDTSEPIEDIILMCIIIFVLFLKISGFGGRWIYIGGSGRRSRPFRDGGSFGGGFSGGGGRFGGGGASGKW